MRPLSLCFGRAKLSRVRSPYRPYLEALETRNLLSVCTVDRLTDNNPDGGGEGSGTAGDLRWCVVESLFRADTINFSVTGTINLKAALPDLTRNVGIEAPGADLVTVRRDSGGNYSIFTVSRDVTASISGLTVNNGSSAYGGAIFNAGTLTLANSNVSGNIAGNGGGAIFNTFTGTLAINNSTISGNSAPGGGGIDNDHGTVMISNSTISANRGSGIANISGTLLVRNSNISGNNSGGGVSGGGVVNWVSDVSAMATITDSTISLNSAPNGAGIFNAGTLAINNCTVANNSASQGGGVYAANGRSVATRNTIIALNTAPSGPDLYGNLGSQGHNLIGNPQDMSGWVDTDILHVNPQLGALQNNGGPTQTMALLPGSPALNAGDPAQLGVADQRGVVRKGGVNIGAYQASASAFVLTAPDTVSAGVRFDVAVTAVDVFGQQAVGYTGTVTFSTTDSDPGVVLPADYTFTLDDGGVHTFTDTGLGETTLITAGIQTLTVTDNTDNTITGSATIMVIGAGPGPGQLADQSQNSILFSSAFPHSGRGKT